MKKTLIAALVAFMPVVAYSAASTNAAGFQNTNTFAFRMSRPATTNEFTEGTNTTVWVTPQLVRPWITTPADNSTNETGTVIYGTTNQWTLVDQWMITTNATAYGSQTITFPKTLTNRVMSIQCTVHRNGTHGTGAPIITCLPRAHTTNSVTVEWYFSTSITPGNSVYGFVRVLGK